MLANLGHKVMSLTRIAVGPITLKGLAPGEYRPLTAAEVGLLRKVAAGISVAPPRSTIGPELPAAAPAPRPPPGATGESSGLEVVRRRPVPTEAQRACAAPVAPPAGPAAPSGRPDHRAVRAPPSQRPAVARPAPPLPRPESDEPRRRIIGLDPAAASPSAGPPAPAPSSPVVAQAPAAPRAAGTEPPATGERPGRVSDPCESGFRMSCTQVSETAPPAQPLCKGGSKRVESGWHGLPPLRRGGWGTSHRLSRSRLLNAVAPSCAAQRTVTVLENVPIARDTYRLRLDDARMAAAIRPGQFLMIRPASATAPLLGRPFALYDVVRDAAGRPTALDVVYLVVGRGTAALAACRSGDRLSVWGPLGNGFGPPPEGPVVFVAGGIGQTPFLALGRWWLGQAPYAEPLDSDQEFAAKCGPFASATSATLLYGVRTADLAAGVEDFQRGGDRRRAGNRRRLGGASRLRHRTPGATTGARPSGRPRLSAVGRPRCSPRSAGWSRGMRSPATSRSKTTWPAASAHASVASPRSARPMARSTSGGCVSRGRSSRQASSTGRRRGIDGSGPDRIGPLRSAPGSGADLVAEPGSPLVVFAGDGLVELFAEGLSDREVLADLLLEDQELLDQRLVGRLVPRAISEPFLLVSGELGDPLMDDVDRLFGPAPFQGQGCRGLVCDGRGPVPGTSRARRCIPRRSHAR